MSNTGPSTILITLLALVPGCGGDAASEDTARDSGADSGDATGDSLGDAADAPGETGIEADAPETSNATDATAEIADATDVADTTVDTAPPEEVTPSLCSALRPADCVYEPAATYSLDIERVDGLSYNDVIGETRTLAIAVYLPIDAPTPLPIVVLSHGGVNGQTNPQAGLDDWAKTFARAGYLAVAIAHHKRTRDSQAALCTALQVQADIQCGVNVNWDEPHDLMRVLDWLEAPPEALAGKLDLEHVAYVGHAEGAGSVLMALGAARNFKCAQSFGNPSPNQDCKVEDVVQLLDERIDIGIALSPPGPDDSGFLRQSYGAVTRPLLMATGRGDGSIGEVANHLALWDLLPAGGKFKLFLDDVGAGPDVLSGYFADCDLLGTDEACAEMEEALFGAGLAFVDGFLKNRLKARQWLASHDVVTGSSGLASWEFK